MPVTPDFLHAVGTQALPFLAGGALVAVEVGSSIAGKVWEWWGKKTREAERRQELEALAGMTSQQVKEAVREVASQLAADQPPAVQARLEGYLTAVPAQIRRTLRRPSDHSGQTVPPDLVLSKAEDLAPLLPPRPPRFVPGDKVPGTDFELIELLGIGGFGEVWKARNAFMPGAPAVALKFCLDPEAAASLRRETALLDRIQREGKHPGIVELRHTFLSADPPYLEYELVEGGDLGGLILDWHRQKGGPTPNQAAAVVRRLAETVAFAHAKGIVHRDLKPANVLLSSAEHGTRIAEPKKEDNSGSGSSRSEFRAPRSTFKIADFGIGGIAAEAAARAAGLTRATVTFSAAAAHGSYSLYYASPEQMRGAAADPRDDVHALGVIWYQLLVGDLTAEAPRGSGWKKRLAAKGMSEPLVDLLDSCVASDRTDRPKDAGEVAGRLGFVIAEPAPGIDLFFDDARPAKSGPPAPRAESEPPAGRAGHITPPARQDPAARPESAEEPAAPLAPGMPRGLIEDALRQSRWADFVTRLREVRLGHDRLRWANGALCWVLPLLLILGLAVGAGCGLGALLADEAYGANQMLGQEIAARYATPTVPIVWRPYSSGGYFRLQEKPSFTSSGMGPRYYVDSGSHPYPSWGRATYAPAVLANSSSLTAAEKKAVDEYIHEANSKMAEAVADYERGRAGAGNLWFGLLAGVGVGLVLLVLFLLARRWKRRSLSAATKELADATTTEYEAELRTLPGPLDLYDPAAVRRMIAALESTGRIPKPLPNPTLLLFHRLAAPF